MTLPAFFDDMPALDIPFPPDVVTSRAVRSDQGLVAFFTFHKALELPAHAHGAQWGTVVAGQLEFTIGGITKTYGPGDSYDIPAGVEHGARIAAGTIVIDVFSEADRYALKPA